MRGIKQYNFKMRLLNCNVESRHFLLHPTYFLCSRMCLKASPRVRKAMSESRMPWRTFQVVPATQVTAHVRPKVRRPVGHLHLCSLANLKWLRGNSIRLRFLRQVATSWREGIGFRLVNNHFRPTHNNRENRCNNPWTQTEDPIQLKLIKRNILTLGDTHWART